MGGWMMLMLIRGVRFVFDLHINKDHFKCVIIPDGDSDLQISWDDVQSFVSAELFLACG